jgi:hypothetical protein
MADSRATPNEEKKKNIGHQKLLLSLSVQVAAVLSFSLSLQDSRIRAESRYMAQQQQPNILPY